MSGITAVTAFIVSLFFSIVIFGLWLRLAVRYLHISTLHPLSQLVYRMTEPYVSKVQGLISHRYQAQQKYDIPAFLSLIAVELFKVIFMSLLAFHTLLPLGLIILYVLADLIIQPCELLFLAILVRVIMSFVNPNWQGPIPDFLRLLTEPLLKLGRRIVPQVSGFDLSPFVILVLLKIITLFINTSLPWRLI